jgi:hypothetical protein
MLGRRKCSKTAFAARPRCRWDLDALAAMRSLESSPGAKRIRTVSLAQTASLSAMTLGSSAAASSGPTLELGLLRGLPIHGALGQLISVSGGLEAGLNSLARELEKASDDTALDAETAFGLPDFRRSLARLSALR